MTKAEIQELAVTNQVRRHACTGLVTDVTMSTVRIAWDGQGRVPTSYSKASASLQEVVLVRKAPEKVVDGRVRRGFYTRTGMTLRDRAGRWFGARMDEDRRENRVLPFPETGKWNGSPSTRPRRAGAPTL